MFEEEKSKIEQVISENLKLTERKRSSEEQQILEKLNNS